MPQGLPPPILRVNDDILEYIAEVSLRDDDGRCDNGETRMLSQVCQRWRELIFGRASFWNDLTVLSSASFDAVEFILEQSQDAPLHISISGLHNSHAHDVLDIIPVERFLSAASVQLFSIGQPSMNELALYLKTAEQLPRLRKLELEVCVWNGTPQLIGPSLVVLLLAEVDCGLNEFTSVLQLALNLDNLRLIRVTFGRNTTRASTTGNVIGFAAPQRGLHVLEIDNNDHGYFHTTLDLIQQFYPLTLSNGASVELRCTWNERPAVELDFLQFATADRLVCMDGLRYLVSYPAEAIKGLQPRALRTPPSFAAHFVGDQIMFRGFNCSLNDCGSNDPRRLAMCHVLSTVRCLVLDKSVVEEAIFFLAHLRNETFALVEDIKIVLQLSVHAFHRTSVQSDVNDICCPRLRSLSIIINAADCLRRDDFDFSTIGKRWGSRCDAIIDQLEVPVGTALTIRAQSSDGVSYAEEIAMMLSNSRRSDAKRTFTFKTA